MTVPGGKGSACWEGKWQLVEIAKGVVCGREESLMVLYLFGFCKVNVSLKTKPQR